MQEINPVLSFVSFASNSSPDDFEAGIAVLLSSFSRWKSLGPVTTTQLPGCEPQFSVQRNSVDGWKCCGGSFWRSTTNMQVIRWSGSQSLFHTPSSREEWGWFCPSVRRRSSESHCPGWTQRPMVHQLSPHDSPYCKCQLPHHWKWASLDNIGCTSFVWE